jgi:hypothetical protein
LDVPTLIYCAGGNRKFAQIAIDNGFEYGAQLPSKIYFPIYFADQDWKKPDRTRYMSCLAEHRPYMATVMDWERQDQLDEVLGWAEEAARYVQEVLIIPKVSGAIHQLPRTIAGKKVRLAYSVPSKYGASEVPVWEFSGWPVHLLGGSPARQMEVAQYLDVRSADGNWIQNVANRFCKVWLGVGKNGGDAEKALRDVEGYRREIDAPYEAFRRSCVNIMAEWKKRAQQS